jgi:hypothetical protein
MSGMFQGTKQVMLRGQLGFNQEYGCVLKLVARSLDTEVSQSLMECIN